MMARFYLFLSDTCIWWMRLFNGTAEAFLMAARFFTRKAREVILDEKAIL